MMFCVEHLPWEKWYFVYAYCSGITIITIQKKKVWERHSNIMFLWLIDCSDDVWWCNIFLLVGTTEFYDLGWFPGTSESRK